MDTHADNFYAGSNWTPMHYTGDICEVSPFFNTYTPVQEIPVARCCTMWTYDEGKKYVLVGDKMLWFGTALENSFINPNQIRAYGLSIKDYPFNANDLEIYTENLSSRSIPQGRLSISGLMCRWNGKQNIFLLY